MSALPPKADIGAAQINVRYGPEADIRCRSNGLNYAIACQPTHFITCVAQECSEHFVRMLSELRRSIIGIEDGFAQLNGTLDSLHGASTRVRHFSNHIPGPQHLAIADLSNCSNGSAGYSSVIERF